MMKLVKPTTMFVLAANCLFAASLVPVSTSPQPQLSDSVLERRYADWSQMDDVAKMAYLLGYGDAEYFLQAVHKRYLEDKCGDDGKVFFSSLEKAYPRPRRTMGQEKEGIDEFYKDWQNKRVPVYSARRIVLLRLAGRSQSEIEDAIREARAEASKE